MTASARRALDGDLGRATTAGELCGNDLGRIVELDWTDPWDGAAERHLIGTLHRLHFDPWTGDAGPSRWLVNLWLKREASGWPIDEPVELAPGHPVVVGDLIDKAVRT